MFEDKDSPIYQLDGLLFQSPGETKVIVELEVVKHLNMIRDKILEKADCQLHAHLVQLDIPLPLFGM